MPFPSYNAGGQRHNPQKDVNMPEMTGAEALRRSLEAEGVDTVFALPGVQIMAAFDALHDSQSIRLISTRHEQTTAYMADGYARVARKPGVALVVPGPGALNASAAIGTAYASSSPVLLISGQIPSGSIGKGEGQLHEVEEQLDIFKPIVKWNTRVGSVSGIPVAIHEAFRQMTTGRPRPVEVEIPPDILAATGDVDILEAERYPVQQPSADLVALAVEALAKSDSQPPPPPRPQRHSASTLKRYAERSMARARSPADCSAPSLLENRFPFSWTTHTRTTLWKTSSLPFGR